MSNCYKEKESFDSVFKIVGGDGRFQWTLLGIVSLQMMLLTLHHLGFVFLGAIPDHWCYVEPLAEIGWTPEEIRNFSSPIISESSQKPAWDSCMYYDLNYTNIQDGNVTYEQAMYDRETHGQYEIGATKQCNKWFYDKSIYKSSAVTQFDLVCENRPLVATIQSTYMLGVLCGSLVLATLSDKIFGRRKITLFSICLVLLSGIGASFAVNYTMFVFLRFCLACGVAGSFQNCYVLLIEYSDAKSRTLNGIFEQLPFALGYMLIPLLAYFFREWSQLQLAFTLSGTLLISYFWILPESARWLASKGRAQEALNMLEKVAKRNGKPQPDREMLLEILSKCEDKELSEIRVKSFLVLFKEVFKNFWQLVKTPKLRQRSLALWSLFFLVTTVYYGLSFGSVRLSNNPFIVVFLSGLLEVPAYSVIVIFIRRFGRRLVIIVAFALTGSVLISLAFTPAENRLLQITFALAGKLFISSAFAVVYLLGAELYPTAMRTTGLGSAVIIGRFGSMTAPYLVDIMGTSGTGMALPITLFGAASFVASAVAFTLPETKSVELPDNVQDVENEVTTERL